MFNRFIAITEFSGPSFSLIDECKKLKALGAEQCLLIQSFVLVDASSMDVSSIFPILEQNLASQKETLEKLGFKVETRQMLGSSASEIAKIAVEENYSVIVVGANKHSLAGEIVLGGLSAEMIHQTQVPVLVMRLYGEQGKPGASLADAVLFPTDFSENADLALPYVEQLIAAGTKKVTLMHVQDDSKLGQYPQEKLGEFDKKDNGVLLEIKQRLQKSGNAQIDIVLKTGSPSAEILNAVKELGIDLVVMGSQGRGFIKEIFLGSVSHNIARHADASVLLIPKSRDEE